MRTVECDGQQWGVKWNTKGQLGGAGRGLERKITISCSPERGPVRYLEITTVGVGLRAIHVRHI